jgi:hypothetical protein
VPRVDPQCRRAQVGLNDVAGAGIPDCHPSFGATGLRQASVVRSDKLLTISRSRVLRRLGSLDGALMTEVDSRLRNCLGL